MYVYINVCRDIVTTYRSLDKTCTIKQIDDCLMDFNFLYLCQTQATLQLRNLENFEQEIELTECGH